jgi:hypothetical protein
VELRDQHEIRLAQMSAPAARGDATARRFTLVCAAIGAATWTPALVLALREGARLGERAVFGADFLSFYAASRLALAGAPADAYDIARHWAMQTQTLASDGYSYFFYPPTFLLLCWPLGLAPFFAALAAWTALGFAACARALRPIAPHLGLSPLLAAPAAMMTATHGQNAFLTTALFAAGALALAKQRPLLAGLCFGALAFKPQLGLLVPVLLLAGGQLRAFLAAAATTLAVALASLLAFGFETWRGFLASLPLARVTLEQGHVDPEKMQSVFAMMRLAGGSVDLAYGAQALAALCVAAFVALAGRRAQPLAAASLAAAGAALATPFVLRYDLMLLLIPLAWLARDHKRAPLRPWEAALAGLVYALPLVPLDLAARTGALAAPPILAAFFAMIARRALANEKGEPEGSP